MRDFFQNFKNLTKPKLSKDFLNLTDNTLPGQKKSLFGFKQANALESMIGSLLQ